jgi:hypothetical protein
MAESSENTLYTGHENYISDRMHKPIAVHEYCVHDLSRCCFHSERYDH